ncbi:hypothetical protein NQ314_013080 [Rhamnusium bicolor]|uniref:Uncharacterized protein n=1 Tax=Rhamnusium bicolor TaxID=1586634 RepID=A0AAV8X951_9CUCU|nr:hypothetical protein NQ314_013080 [Rhamnusium bicolor]
MYSLYLEDCKENGLKNEDIAKDWLYLQIFNFEYNYSFKSPDNDTCDMCDKYQLQLQEADSLESRMELQKEYDQHLSEANNRYKIKSEDKRKTRENLLQEKVVMIDLQ